MKDKKIITLSCLVILSIVLIIFNLSNKKEEVNLNYSVNLVNSKINDYLKNNRIDNYVYNYIDEENNVVVVGLVEIEDYYKNNFISSIFINDSEYIKNSNLINFRESKDVFKGVITDIGENTITVEAKENSKYIMAGDVILVTLNSSGYYNKNEIVYITYNGMVEESNPAKIAAIKIEKEG